MWKLKCSTGDDSSLQSLNDFVGRQIWEYDPEGGTQGERDAIDAAQKIFHDNRFVKKHSSDELMRLQRLQEHGKRSWDAPSSDDIEANQLPMTKAGLKASLRRGVGFYSSLQADDGHWAGDYGGPMFLMPGLVITCYVTGVMDTVLPEPHKVEMRRYLHNHQNEDGGYGLHIEGHSTMFGTVLSYVTLRLLGEAPEAAVMVSARNWIKTHGGACMIPSWGKFWIAVLGCYSWNGLNPMPPEMWLLPYALPVHPGNLFNCVMNWVHTKKREAREK
eukprot:gene22865-27634_t